MQGSCVLFIQYASRSFETHIKVKDRSHLNHLMSFCPFILDTWSRLSPPIVYTNDTLLEHIPGSFVCIPTTLGAGEKKWRKKSQSTGFQSTWTTREQITWPIDIVDWKQCCSNIEPSISSSKRHFLTWFGPQIPSIESCDVFSLFLDSNIGLCLFIHYAKLICSYLDPETH